jgi:long-chain acyl-CoA synthetase
MEWINAISPEVSGPGRIGRIALPDMVRRSTRKYPQKVAIVDGARRMTYAAFDADIDRLATALVGHGLRKGDRVATLGGNSYEYLVAMFGIQRAGLVWLPINHNLRPDDIAFVLDHAEPRFAIVDDALYAGPIGPVVDARLPAHAIATVSADHTRTGASRLHFDALLATGEARDPNVAIEDRDVCQIMYTSGTTGRPKGVMHSHLSVYVALLGNLVDYEMRAADISNAMLPLFHCAQHCMVAGAFLAGQTVVVMRSVDPGHLIETIAREKITVVLSLPPIYGAMLDHPARASHDLSSVRLCIYGMMQMPEHTLRRLVAEVCPNFALGTGQTEIYPSTLTFKPELQLEKIGPYWGDSCVGTETAIMDDAGNLLGPGEIGEIVHRGPNVMAGYFRDPEATEKARAFGWHHTGDLGMFDADGLLIFTDRKKDMIKSGGENVASIVVERALLAHAGVAAAAAIGLPHPRWFEAVTGVVLRKPGATVDEAQLLAHCKEHLSIHEVPKAIRFVEQFPLTATGKIQKNLLRERFADVYEEAGTAAR